VLGCCPGRTPPCDSDLPPLAIVFCALMSFDTPFAFDEDHARPGRIVNNVSGAYPLSTARLSTTFHPDIIVQTSA
jgi:hypothetical protein